MTVKWLLARRTGLRRGVRELDPAIVAVGDGTVDVGDGRDVSKAVAVEGCDLIAAAIGSTVGACNRASAAKSLASTSFPSSVAVST
jgi:hypothetical protein